MATTLSPRVMLFDHNRNEVIRQQNNTAGGHTDAEAAATVAGIWTVCVQPVYAAGGEYALNIGQ